MADNNQQSQPNTDVLKQNNLPTTTAKPPVANIQTPEPPQVPQINVKADIRQEYVSSGGYSWIASYFRALPTYIDDVTADFGDDLYERMMNDPVVSSSVNLVKLAVLSNGLSLLNPVKDDTSSEYQQAQEIIAFCQRNIDGLNDNFDAFLWSILDGIAYGYKVAEQTYEIATDGEDAGRLVLKCLKVKPRKSTALVVDAYFNVSAVLGLLPGQGASTIMTQGLIGVSGTPGDGKFVPANLLPREKFVVFTFRPKDSDPRGTSILRPAYTPWWHKQQVWGEYLKFLAQFASPSLVGITGEGAQGYIPTDSNGNPLDGSTAVTPEQVMVTALQALRNGSVVGLPFGSTVTPLQVAGDGNAFLSAISLYDNQMTKAILHQTLATGEADHQTGAATGSHQDVLDLVIKFAKQSLKWCLINDLFRPLIRYNFGEDAARQFCPDVSLSESNDHDFASDASAIAQLQSSGYLDISQYQKIDAFLGLPERDIQRQMQERQMGMQAQQQALQAKANGSNDDGDGQDKENGQDTEQDNKQADNNKQDSKQVNDKNND